MQIDLLTGEISEDSYDYAPSLEAYYEFTRSILKGEQKTVFDKIIIDLISDNLICVGDIRDNTFWWRARINDESNPLPHIKNQIGINRNSPNGGRFNACGRGQLYLSKTRDNALEEVQALKSNVFSLGRFKLIEPIKVFDFVYAPVSNTYGNYGGLNAPHARYFLVLVLENYIKANFSSEVYTITQYVSRLFQKNGVEGIFYNSVKDGSTGCLCLFSEVHTQFRYTRQWRIIDFDEENHKYCCELIGEAK